MSDEEEEKEFTTLLYAKKLRYGEEEVT